MTCIALKFQDGSTGRICIPDVYRIRTAAGEFYFEYHKFCGPSLVDPHTGDLLPAPAEDHPFWPALTAWIENGSKVTAEGDAITEASE